MTALCRALADTLLAQRDEADAAVLPPGVVRVPAYPAAHFAVGDGGAAGRDAGSGEYGFMDLNPGWPQWCSTTQPTAWPGWPTRSPPMANSWTPASWCWPGMRRPTRLFVDLLKTLALDHAAQADAQRWAKACLARMASVRAWSKPWATDHLCPCPTA